MQVVLTVHHLAVDKRTKELLTEIAYVASSLRHRHQNIYYGHNTRLRCGTI